MEVSGGGLFSESILHSGTGCIGPLPVRQSMMRRCGSRIGMADPPASYDPGTSEGLRIVNLRSRSSPSERSYTQL